jgi:putrescine aminotransferase
VGTRVSEPFFAGDDAPVFRHGITYSGHATACAVAQENLDILERERLVARAAALEPLLRAALAPLAEREPVAEVRCGTGFMAGVRLVEDVDGEAVARESIERGVITRLLADNVLQVCPPFVVAEADVTRIADTLAAALDHAHVTA